jgi:predicted ATPase
MQFYHLQPTSIPDIDTYDPRQRLRADGSNLASVLAALQHAERGTKQRIEEFLRVVLPTLARVTVEPVRVERSVAEAQQPADDLDGRKIALVFHQRVGNTVALFGPAQMSEGTLRTLALLVALYQIEPFQKRRPTLIAIEDVEAAVHPAELAVLLDALEKASLSTQVIVTTQSSDLLDKRDIPPDSLLVVGAEQGVTRIGPLDEACRSVLNRRLYTLGELLRIGQVARHAPPSPPDAGSPPMFPHEVGQP